MARITDKAQYGEHITLVCENHPELEWSTKNIGYQGDDGAIHRGRTLFFWSYGRECDCNSRLLRLHPKYATLEPVEE